MISPIIIKDLLTKTLNRRKRYILDSKIEAYRLLDSGESHLPLAIDIYKDNAVLHVFSTVEVTELKEIEEALSSILKIRAFFYKNRTKNELNLPKSPPKTLIIEEYGLKFSINLAEYLDTGLFLDHRETRKWIGDQAKNKTVLNTFAYTGSFSVYAAAGGAAKTYSVDLSKTYCDWIKKNLELNKLPLDRNWVYKMDTREFFKYAKRKKLSFDIIIIDPPSFSRNKGSSFSVQKDHPELINDALELLNPKGFILFSNNKQGFRLNNAKLLPCSVQNIQSRTIPADFFNREAHHCFIIRPV